jgi:hypothetical protein
MRGSEHLRRQFGDRRRLDVACAPMQLAAHPVAGRIPIA